MSIKPFLYEVGRWLLRLRYTPLNSSTNHIPPFWPILSAIGTATYNLAKFCVAILKEFTVNEYTVSDSCHFKQLLTLAVKSSCFVFNDIYYKQIESVAMGSPLGPTFANLFLDYCEHKWLENCPLQFKSKLYGRYVEGIFFNVW